MEQTQTELLGKLYTLRAGLSTLSILNDKLFKNENNFVMNGYKTLNELADNYHPRNANKYIANQFLEVICDSIINDNNSTKRINDQSLIKEKNYEKIAELRTSVTHEQYNNISNSLSTNLLNKLKSVPPKAHDAMEKFFEEKARLEDKTCLYWCCTDECVEHFKEIVEGGKTIIAKLNTGLKKLTRRAQREHYENEVKKIERLFPIFESLKDDYNNFARVNMDLQQVGKELFNNLQKTCAPILDMRDWQHLDLVIYFLETRRADNIKEALLAVDREIQTQRIENCIKQATARICNTLREGFNMLNQTIENGYRALSAQIASSTALISNQLSGLISAVNLNNALRAKANVSCTQLMNDVKSLREYFVK